MNDVFSPPVFPKPARVHAVASYAYRICPRDSDLSEACFQRGHLNFIGNTQTIVNATGHVVAKLPARRLSDGTVPPRSQWTVNPFPQEAELGPRIPGLPELYGRGPFPYSVVDNIAVPANITPGHYVRNHCTLPLKL